ncbi:hypothetical protein D3C73_1593530 [compost metagenome]
MGRQITGVGDEYGIGQGIPNGCDALVDGFDCADNRLEYRNGYGIGQGDTVKRTRAVRGRSPVDKLGRRWQ